MAYSRVVFSWLLSAAAAAIPIGSARAQTAPVKWESPAELHRLLKKRISGTLILDNDAVEFRSPKFSQRWLYGEIRTFDLTENRELALTGYENRRWRAPGERTFRFTLAESMPPAIADRFATQVARPVINGIPLPPANVLATVPAHQRARFGGSNGTLRFEQDRIDYVATDGSSSRTWRWSDIQTIANPNPWEFRISGYREIVAFDLKQPMPRELFDRLWSSLYAADLNLTPGTEGHRQ